MTDHQTPSDQAGSKAAKPSNETASKPGTRLSMAGSALLSVVLVLLLIDAAVETFLAGASVRWIVVGTVAAYLVLSVLLRGKLTFGASAWGSLFILLILLAATAWWPGGMSAGVVLLRQPTSTVLAAVTAAAVSYACWTVLRLRFLPRAGNALIGLFAVYAVAAFVDGIRNGVPYAALLSGRSIWDRAPFWLQGAFIGAVVIVPVGLLAQLAVGAGILRERRVRVWAKQALVLMLVMAITASGITQPSSAPRTGAPSTATSAGSVASPIRGSLGGIRPPLPPASAEEALERLNHYVAALQQVGGGFPQSDFDARAMANQLGDDPNTLFAFVRDGIHYEPYRGILRGANGTLMNRAGNAADKSLLLAALLRTHGHSVRIARGELDIVKAQALLERVLTADSSGVVKEREQGYRDAQSVVEAAATSDDEKRFVNETVDRARSTRRDLAAAVARDQAFILRHLTSAGVDLAAGAAVQRTALLGAVRDHYWVQLQIDGQWTDLDPSFPGTAGQNHATVTSTFDQDGLPAELFHRVRFRIQVEVLSGREIHNREVVSVTVPSHELVGRPVSFVNVPKGDVSDLDSLKKITRFLPVLQVGDDQHSGSEFSTTGGEPSGGNPAATLGAELFGGSTESQEQSLVGEWLVIEVVGPRDEPRTYRRLLVDCLGRERRQNQAVEDYRSMVTQEYLPILLAGQWDIGVMSALYNPSFFISEMVKAILNDQELLGAGIRARYFHEVGSLRELEARLRYPGELLAFFASMSLALLDENVTGAGNVRWYIDHPLIATFKRFARIRAEGAPTPELSFVQAFDVIEPRVQIVSSTGTNRAEAFVRFGALATNLERTLLDQAGGSRSIFTPKVLNASAVFERAEQQHIPSVVLTLSSASEIRRITAGPALQRQLQADVENGFVVIVPQRTVTLEEEPTLAWWRVRLEDGYVLGIGEDGEGQGLSEQRIMMRTMGAVMCSGAALFRDELAQRSGRPRPPAWVTWGHVAACLAVFGTWYPTVGAASTTVQAVADATAFVAALFALCTVLATIELF